MPRTRVRSIRFLGAAALIFAATSVCEAQLAPVPRPAPEYDNAVGFGLSYGLQNDRDAAFWGWSVDWSRTIGGHWFAAAALTWDRETENFDERPDTEVDSFTLVGSVAYAISRRFSLTTGLGKGFADTDNPGDTMKFANGDLGTGIVLGFATPGLPQYARDSINFSLSYEYNFTQGESSASLDVSFGWSF